MRRLSVLVLGCFLLAGCSGGGGGNSGDNSADANKDQFPMVLSINPVSGPIAGGTTVMVTGRYFAKRASNASVQVSMAGVLLPATVTSDIQLSFVTPEGTQFVSQNVPAPSVIVAVKADGKLSSGLTGSNDPRFQYVLP